MADLPFDSFGRPAQCKLLGQAVTFDDVSLVPRRSSVTPDRADVSTRLTRRIELPIPLVSAPMDSVTESRLAIALARVGGIGIIHRNLSIEKQCDEVRSVKSADVTTGDGPVACLDDAGRLRVGAAVGVLDDDRVTALMDAGVDVLVLDTAHGHSENVIEAVGRYRKRHDINVIAGNIVTGEAARDLIDAGADALKVGVGPGSICTTRVVAGVGVPQITAIMSVAEVAETAGVPIIADGGIRYSGDIAKAIGAGAHCVMLGSLFAGVEESPGDTEEIDGRRFKAYRGMGSLGAMAKGSSERYGRAGSTPEKLVPEGIEGCVPCRGPLAEFVHQMIGGLKSGMGYCGAATIEEMRIHAKFYGVTAAGMAESHPHDVTFIKETPNYAKE